MYRAICVLLFHHAKDARGPLQRRLAQKCRIGDFSDRFNVKSEARSLAELPPLICCAEFNPTIGLQEECIHELYIASFEDSSTGNAYTHKDSLFSALQQQPHLHEFLLTARNETLRFVRRENEWYSGKLHLLSYLDEVQETQ